MATRFNLNILPIKRQMEKTISVLPGLFITKPPRRSPRRRTQERLVLHLHLDGNAPLSDTAMEQLLTKLAEVYYQTDGSTTSALRNVADVLNKYLLDRNYRAATKGLKAIGYLTQIVLREDRVLYAQCGPSYIYKITGDIVEDLHDPELSGSGLGLGKAYKVRYHQINLQPNQLLILTPKTQQTWTDNLLKNLTRMKHSAVVQRLLHKLDEDVEAVLFFPVDGEGEVKIIEPNWELGVGALEMTELNQGGIVEDLVEDQAVNIVSPIQISEDSEQPVHQSGNIEREKSLIKEEFITPRRRVDKKPGLASQLAAEIGPAINDIQESKAWSFLSSTGGSIGDAVRKGWHSLLGLISKMLPDDQILDLPSWSLSLIAILVPVLMVIFGSVFYIKRGRNQLYDDHLSQAKTLLTLAQTQLDTPEYYQTITDAMDQITAARSYQQTDEVEELFSTLRLEMDTLDRVTRLDYQPLFSRGLGADVTISKIVVTAWNDLYMLNADYGTVIWAQSNPDGYQIIDEFSCGPIDGHITVGPLVDIVALPTSQEDQATILGIDKNHTMIFCYADLTETPVIFEDTSYTLGRGPAEAITMSSSTPYNLYILDPEKRAIWIEYQSQNYHEGSEYFGAIDSPEMTDAIELATNGSELFILHSDGYMTKCVTERVDADPICTTPFDYSDPRPGSESGPFFAGANFDSFAIKGSPGMAVYLLDSEDQALYRFSTQLEFQEQFRPLDGIIDQPVTAFTVTMSDRVFMAVDNQVYTAQLLP
jgi:hypothetical protein